MDDSLSRLKYLLQFYTSGKAIPAERRELMELIRLPIHEEAVKNWIADEMELLEQPGWEMQYPASEERAAQILSNILQSPAVVPVVPLMQAQKKGKYKLIWRAAAAVILVIACLGGYWFLSGSQSKNIANTEALPSHDVAPGGNKAILTLANGSKIILDSAHFGKLTQQGNANITKLDNGKLAYTSFNDNPNEVLYNVLTTPRGGQYQLTLPDGTRVWLNAASSIKYPTAFTGAERKVVITGEAYFEVAKNDKMPFVVNAGNTKTVVLGTHFNINAYEDEKTLSITLLEGTVKITSGADEKILHPGQQAARNSVTQSLSVRDADTYQAVAWTNGQFDFNNTDLPAIMRQISRWYNVDVIYHSNLDNAKFGGGISRQLNLSGILRLLDKSGVKTKMENRKIIILP